MMTIEEMNQIREKLGLTYQKISMESGIPIGTVQKVLGGFTKNPRMETMRELENTLGWMNYAYESYHQDSAPVQSLRERPAFNATEEGSAVRDTEHVWTASEREELPEYRRTEIIDGKLYDMAAPSTVHQDICSEIFRKIADCISRHSMPCHAYMAPTDVVIDRDEYTIVQPDVFVVCDRSQISRKNIQGPPAYILEVLSPSTDRKDRVEKLGKYLNAGVQEYWMVDPDRRQVIVFDMRGNTVQGAQNTYALNLYGFQDHIPLLISDGRCEINMQEISNLLDELYT